jgi:AcrR family transcriptional regulator
LIRSTRNLVAIAMGISMQNQESSEVKIKKKIQKRTLESRDKLLKAAYELFVEKGYYNTNTKEIVKKAGISVGNFYNYYKDKADIYLALTTIHLESSYSSTVHLFQDLEKLSKSQAQNYIMMYVHEQLVRASKTVRFFDDSKVIEKENKELAIIIKETEQKIINVLENALRGLRKTSPKISFSVMARMLYVTVNEVSNDIIKVEDEKEREEYIETLVDFIVSYTYD